jgi:hypothetical protein
MRRTWLLINCPFDSGRSSIASNLRSCFVPINGCTSSDARPYVTGLGFESWARNRYYLQLWHLTA